MNNHDQNAEIAIREAMGAHFVPPPEYDAATAAMSEIMANVAVRKDSEAPWGEGNRAKCRAVLITGLSRTGKTDLATQLAADVSDLRSVDGVEVAHHPVTVECPSPFSQGLLLNLIFRELLADFRTKRLLPVTSAYARVDQQLPVHRPTLLVLDEFQYAADPNGVGAARKDGVIKDTFGYLRHLLDHAAWPVPLLLVGLPEIAAQLDDPQYRFLNEKIDRIRVAPMAQGSKQEIERLRSALTAYCEDAGVTNAIVENDFFNRLIHSTDHARGLALELCQTSVLNAWRAGRRELQMRDFADRYRISTGEIDDQNPFLIAGWHNTDRSRLAKDSQNSELGKTRSAKQ